MQCFGRFIPPAPGLALWLRADTVVPVAGTVDAWVDQSPAAYPSFLQATVADQPLYVASAFNGKPTIRSDTTDRLVTTGATTSAARTEFFLYEPGASGFNYWLIRTDLASGLIHKFVGNAVEYFNQGVPPDRYTFVAAPAAGPHIVAVRQTDGVTLSGWWDGVLAFGPVVPVNPNRPTRALYGIPGGANGSTAALSEILNYSRALSDQEMFETFRYLGPPYGVSVP